MNSFKPGWCTYASVSWFIIYNQVMACNLFGATPLFESVLTECKFDQMTTNVSDILIKIPTFYFRKMQFKMSSAKPRASHDDIIKWKHFPCYCPFVRGIHRSQVISPHKGQWSGALMFSLICAWTNGSVNNRNAGDLRRHRAHYDVIEYMLHYCGIAWMPGRLIRVLSVFPTFVQQLFQATNNDNSIVLHHWSIVRGNHRWPMDSSHKGPLMCKACLCYHAIVAQAWMT